MELINSFVRNPVKVSVGVLLVALFGAISLFRMPMQLTPEVETPTIEIETSWPGASPQEVEREIIQEQEEQLKGVEGLRKMTSESRNSSGRITLEFAVGSNLTETLVKVNARLQQVREYPIEADEPTLSTSNSSNRAIAWFILKARAPSPEKIAEFQQANSDLAAMLEPARRAHNSGLRVRRLALLTEEHPELRERLAPILPPDLDIPKLRRFAEDFIEARFERVSGVSNSNVIGGREDELQVVVDPERLAARRLTIKDIRDALSTQNKDTSGGDVWDGKRSWVVRTLGQFSNPEQVAGAIIARRDGMPVYVRDVAEVQLGYKKPDGLVRNFGSSSIAINIQRETGANVLDVMADLRIANAQLNEGLLKDRGLQLEQVYDETEYIYSSIGLVQNNIWIGALLTAAVLMLFLRSARSTFVIFLAIPTSVIGTFLVLNMLGRSLNVISLAGLAFAVGMLVDNAVVVLENIYRHYQQGEAPHRAAVRGAQEVWGAVVASTLTTLAVFVPVLFVEEEAGQLFRDIALAISSAVGLSLIMSITLIPTAAAKILPRRPGDADDTPDGWRLDRANGDGRPADNNAGESSRAPAVFERVLRPLDAVGSGFTAFVVAINARLQKSRGLRLATVAGFVVASIGLSYAMAPRVEYLPTGNRNLLIGIILPPAGYNIDQLMSIGRQIERDMQPYWDVDPTSPEAAELPYPIIGDFFFVARGRSVFLGVRAEDPLRGAELVPMLQGVFGKIPGTIGIAKQTSLFEQGLSAGRTVDIEIIGPELEKLVALGGRVMGAVQQAMPEAQAIPRPSLDLTSPELHVTPRWEQAADLDVTALDLGYTVDALVDGARATDYYIGGDKIDLSIIGDDLRIQRTQDLAAVPVATPTGQVVPLAAVAHVTLGSGPEQINHRERQRAITIEVSPPADLPLEEAMNIIQQQIIDPLEAEGELGGLYQVNLAGTADKLNATWLAMRWNLLLALAITYLLMAALFESWLYPLVIIFSVPLGAVGGVLGLWVLNFFVLQPLDVLTMLGFVVLIGTVVNNPILIVHQSLNLIRDEGLAPRDAIIESVRTRIRPIFMTTMTTLLGLAPLVVIPGAGAELYRGLGSVVLGGLLASTLFTLILVPALFSLTLEAKESLVRVFFGRRSVAAAAAVERPVPRRPAQRETVGPNR